MDKRWDVFVYGDVNIDLVVPGVEALPDMGTEAVVPTMQTFVGGGAALFAMGVAKLGLKPVFQGSVGNDMYGKYIRALFQSLGVDDSLMPERSDCRTGISIAFTTARDRCFLTYLGNNEGLSLKHMDLSQVARARHVHITSYAGESNHAEYYDVLRRIRQIGGVTVSFDVGWDPTGVWYEGIFDLMPMIDILFMNETECLHYTRSGDVEAGARKLAAKAGMAVIKLGANGSLAVRGDEMARAEAFRVTAVDTTGAGDSFNAGFVSAYLSGLTIDQCLRQGNACGALSVTALGGNTAFPTRDELDAWLKKQGSAQA